jgi:dephospho-CoA kinase
LNLELTIIGITGTLGSGKGTVVEYLVMEKGFAHFSVRQFLLEEIRKRGLPENRDSMRIVANELRKKNSPSYITDQLYQQALKEGRNAVIESIRTPGEIESLRSNGNFYLVAIDADPADRFERIRKRNSETDHVDYKTFLENEEQEMTSTDPNRQNLQRCREMADFIILNNGTVEELHNMVDKLFREITKQHNI